MGAGAAFLVAAFLVVAVAFLAGDLAGDLAAAVAADFLTAVFLAAVRLMAAAASGMESGSGSVMRERMGGRRRDEGSGIELIGDIVGDFEIGVDVLGVVEVVEEVVEFEDLFSGLDV